MEKKRILLISVFFIFISGYFVSSETYGKEWWILNITNDTIDENGISWGNVTNFSENPQINNTPQINVSATMEATLWWVEVQLNTSEINFGNVEKGKSYVQKYQISARGTVDVIITPVLKNQNDSFFSNLKFSGSSSASKYKSIGNYNLNFTGLSKNNKNWSVLTANGELRNLSGTNKGEQYIKLDLTRFEGIIPFDVPMQNTILFQITPVWSSVEPIPSNKVYINSTEE